jgi:hypothetical protein
MMTRRSILWFAATAVLVTLGGDHAEARSFRDRCAGILHQDGKEIWFGGAKGEGESICVISSSQVAKVLKVCTAGHYCAVVGATRPCKDSGECAEIRNVVSVTTRKASRRP